MLECPPCRNPSPKWPDLEYSPTRQSRMNAVQTELFLLCLIATLATFVAVALDDALFIVFFAAASGFSLIHSLRSGGQN